VTKSDADLAPDGAVERRVGIRQCVEYHGDMVGSSDHDMLDWRTYRSHQLREVLALAQELGFCRKPVRSSLPRL
jgi:hypothetical protein